MTIVILNPRLDFGNGKLSRFFRFSPDGDDSTEHSVFLPSKECRIRESLSSVGQENIRHPQSPSVPVVLGGFTLSRTLSSGCDLVAGEGINVEGPGHRRALH
jgi:hypothetical protein